MGIIFILFLNSALFRILGLCVRSLDAFSLSERRFSRLLLLLPVGIVALGVINVGVNDLLGSLGNRLNLLGVNRLVSVVICYESRSNSSLVLLSFSCVIVSICGNFLLYLGHRRCGLCLDGSIVRLNVGIYGLCRILPTCFLLCLCECLIFLLLLLHCGSDGDKLFTFVTLVALLTVSLLVRLGVDLLMLIGKLCRLKIVYRVSLYVCIRGSYDAYC